MVLNNLIFFFALAVFCVLFNKYFLAILIKYKLNLLIDNQFEKLQEADVVEPHDRLVLSGGSGQRHGQASLADPLQ